ncbi:fumarylacetoacetate hydrolase family protein [Microbacterium sp. B35-04]|uniref:fumarylacetoacetate hydrolase family protein n=1 Tax=Microbacterium sp. B35-04 TaxID=1961716 RepID=UPI0013D73EEF|nr:fumarylacetoacetate hydrolase family protein [Microbacterium sp. B35-04]
MDEKTDAVATGNPGSSADPRFAALPARPGKIVAVHLSYASRADQRGRRPQHPSYFFKPSSSVAASGSTIERPAGTELLAFEGEIALVIGSTARRVSLADAWSHVAGITAANDFGLYDLRANDKGSNVRSKGGDGYTPIGPALIDAALVHPDALRVRTWLNGALVQDDTAAGMIFPLTQLVADLSQHFTLEPGDVILTGTPAGSSVAQPGDVVEVEVDVPGGPSSGRLVTTVVQGTADFDPDLGSLPAADDLQRAEAWGSREAASSRLLSERGTRSLSERGTSETKRAEPTSNGGEARFDSQGRSTTGISAALRAKLEAVPVAGLSAQLRKRGLNNVHIDGVRPLRAADSPDRESKLVGTARTLRFVPNREDLFASHGGGYNAQKRVFDAVGDGEVVVIEARGDAGSGTLGDILAIRAHARGAAGIVTDGGVRDAAAVAAVGIPVYSSGAHPAVLGRKHVPWDADLTIACGGTTVQPGDVIVGDADGVVVIPPDIVEEVVDAALAQEDEDAWIAERVAEGHPVDGLFPMNAEWRARFEAAREASAAVSGERPATQTQRPQGTATLEDREAGR